MNIYIAVNITASLLAIFLGIFILLRKKGDRLHKASGKTYSGLILMACISSLAIHNSDEEFFHMHFLSAWVLVCMVIALIAIKLKNITIHRICMLGNYGGLVVMVILQIVTPSGVLN